VIALETAHSFVAAPTRDRHQFFLYSVYPLIVVVRIAPQSEKDKSPMRIWQRSKGLSATLCHLFLFVTGERKEFQVPGPQHAHRAVRKRER
jgi:hypothetical protein